MTLHFPRKALLLATSLLAGLSLAACNQTPAATQPPEAALALVDTQPFDGASAPPAEALPAAPPAPLYRVADESRYRYLDRAWYLNDAFGDAPPDYFIDYDGTDPWYWQSDDRAYRVVEWVGGYPRYYYYEAGADLPFLVRDVDYAYGYDAGRLAVIYDRGGQVLPYDAYAPRAEIAGRYLLRARALRDAAERDRRQAVARTAWVERRQAFETDRARLREQQRQQQAWAAYHQANQAQEQPRWNDERRRREARAARVAQTLGGRDQAMRPLPSPQIVQAEVEARKARDKVDLARAEAKSAEQRREFDSRREAQGRAQAQVQAAEREKAAADARLAQQQRQQQAQAHKAEQQAQHARGDADRQAQQARREEAKAAQDAARPAAAREPKGAKGPDKQTGKPHGDKSHGPGQPGEGRGKDK